MCTLHYRFDLSAPEVIDQQIDEKFVVVATVAFRKKSLILFTGFSSQISRKLFAKT